MKKHKDHYSSSKKSYQKLWYFYQYTLLDVSNIMVQIRKHMKEENNASERNFLKVSKVQFVFHYRSLI